MPRSQYLAWLLPIVCVWASPLVAEDESPKPPAKAAAPNERVFDDKLLDEPEEAEKPAPPLENPIETAVAGMRSATEHLKESRTGEETREIQEQVIRDLQKLIDLAEQSQNQKPNSPPPSQPPPQDQQDQSDNNSDQSQSPDNANQPPSPQNGETGTEQQPQANERSRESSEDANQTANGGGTAPPDRQHLMRDVWGHLPPAVRKKLLNMSGDKYLPKYEDLRKRYFELLAEEGQSGSN